MVTAMIQDVVRREGPAFQEYARGDNAESAIAAYKRKTLQFLQLTPGEAVLDAGCGVGIDTMAMSRIVGPLGLALGIDSDLRAIRRARSLATAEDSRAQFSFADLHATGLPSARFDACCLDRVLRELRDPVRAIVEMVRLLRPGGRLAVFDVDWRTLLVEPCDRRVTARLLEAWLAEFPRGALAFQIPAVLADLGLEEPAIASEALLLRDVLLADRLFALRAIARHGVDRGAVNAIEATDWLASIHEGSGRRFFGSMTGFVELVGETRRMGVAGSRLRRVPHSSPPMPRFRIAAAVLVLLLLAGARAHGQETGTIRGRIDHVKARLRPAAVYVEAIPGAAFDPPLEEPLLDQLDYTFLPRVLPVLAGTSVRLANGDDVRHNLHDAADPSRLDVSLRPREFRSAVFGEPGVVTIRCRFHSDMVAYVVVVETPWFATTDGDGAFEIRGVPPGSYRLTYWHEALPAQVLAVRVPAGGAAEATFRP